jgi:hypothetical protein
VVRAQIKSRLRKKEEGEFASDSTATCTIGFRFLHLKNSLRTAILQLVSVHFTQAWLQILSNNISGKEEKCYK